jgi:multiple sugar transport system substrate-binding protein
MRSATPHRQWNAAAAFLVVAILASACSSGSSPSGGASGGEITVALINSPTQAAFESMGADFTKATGIKVNFVDMAYDAGHQKEVLAFQTKQGQYDVIQFDNPFLAGYVENGYLEPLATYAKNSKEYDLSDFPQTLIDYGSVDGKFYGLNLSTEPFVTWYRTDILAENGLTPPKTWDEWMTAAKKIQESGKASGSMMGYSSSMASWWFIQLLWSFGGDLLDSKFNPTVDTPEALAATQYYKDLLKYSPSSAITSDGDAATSVFCAQDVGLILQYSGYWPTMADPKQCKAAGKFAVQKAPAGKVDITQLVGWNIGIPSDSKKKDLAWRYLEWNLGKSNAKRFLEEGAAAIGRTSVVTDSELLKKYPYLAALQPAAEVGRRLPAIREWPEVSQAIGSGVADILSEKVSVADGLKALNGALRDIFQKSGRY